MKTRRFDFDYKALRVIKSMELGAVPERQNYNGETGEFTPDYKLTPCVLTPRISVIDADNTGNSGMVNSKLANIKWYEVLNGTRTLISTGNTNYEIIQTGADAGRIKVKRNFLPQDAVSLVFEAEYIDNRLNQVHKLTLTQLISCLNSEQLAPRLELDAADQTIYNPLRDNEKQTVHAHLYLGGEVPASQRIFVWEIKRANGTFTEAGSELLDLDVVVSADGASITIDRSLMDELTIRCRAKYGQNPANVTLTDASPTKVITFKRRLPDSFDSDMYGVPTNIPPGTSQISPEAKVVDAIGEIASPEKELYANWYMATNKASGALSFSLIGTGFKPKLSTSLMSASLGGVLALEVKDAGAWKALEVDTDTVLVDSDGAILLIR